MRSRAGLVVATLVLAVGVAVGVAAGANADTVVPPWTDPNDVPLPAWARSVAPTRADTAIAAAPGRADLHRGTTGSFARLPLYGAKRAAGCAGRWLEVGPLAWICSDAADLSPDAAYAPPPKRGEDGLPYRYFFVGRDGAEAFLNLETAAETEAPEETLDAGFAVAIAEERDARGERWGRTRHGKWIPMRELSAFHPSPFHGEEVAAGALDFAWVTSDSAPVYSTPIPRGKSAAVRARFDRVAWREERVAPHGGGAMVRVSDDGASPEAWIRSRDLARPTLAAPPDAVGGATTTERWIDVDLAAQILVAYDGARPVFATLVSAGKGAQGSETATPVGVHRVWVKLLTSDMDNLAADSDDEAEHERFSIEDVPYVQFFDRAVALHGAFWHRDFGRPHSHGCVNLAPKDAAWLFAFTSPHLPAAWSAAYPMDLERGTAVRVR